MRLASAIVSSLLLAASTAMAEPSASTQDPAAARAIGPAASAPEIARHDLAGPGAPHRSLARARRTAYPTPDSGAADSDRQTEANCYIVFGNLRCDRIAAPRRSPTSR